MEEKKNRWGSVVLLSLCVLICWANFMCLPALFGELETDLSLSPSQMAGVGIARNVLLFGLSPLVGSVADTFSRKYTLMIGMIWYGIFTALMATAQDLALLTVFSGLCGIGMSAVFPITQAIVADSVSESRKGATRALGAVIGTLFATALTTPFGNSTMENSSSTINEKLSFSPTDILYVLSSEELEEESTPDVFIFGVSSWRVALVAMGLATCLLGCLIPCAARNGKRDQCEDKCMQRCSRRKHDPEQAALIAKQRRDQYEIEKQADETHLRKKLLKILTTKTLILIICSGMIGTMPWDSFSFLILFLETAGNRSIIAGAVFCAITVGLIGGTIVGGVLVDRIGKKYPLRGRVALGQISMFSAIPFVIGLFLLVPPEAQYDYVFGIIGTITGLFLPWAGLSNTCFITEVVDPKLLSFAFSVDRLFEGTVGSFGGLLVGLIAQWMGYKKGIRSEANAKALATGLLASTAGPWLLAGIIYTSLYFVFPKEKLAEERRRADLEEKRKSIAGLKASMTQDVVPPQASPSVTLYPADSVVEPSKDNLSPAGSIQ